MYCELELVKKQCQIDDDFNDDDAYLIALTIASEQAVARHLNKSLDAYIVDGELPQPLKQAVLLLVANFYNEREPVTNVSANKIPYSYEYLIDLYRDLDKPF